MTFTGELAEIWPGKETTILWLENEDWDFPVYVPQSRYEAILKLHGGTEGITRRTVTYTDDGARWSLTFHKGGSNDPK